jgi:hypothetical protein
MLTRRMPLILAAIAMLAWVTAANAGVMIKTNDGIGADAEVRESEQSTDLGGNVLIGYRNRGNNVEAATRVKTANRSSVSYFKFDISGLPAIGDAFWTTNKQATFQANVRDTNLQQSRLKALRPGATSDSTNPNDWDDTISATQTFAMYGLDPNGTYANDPGGTGMKTDRSGNTYAVAEDKYEWDEGDGTDGSGITFYDAPGITPHCMVSGSCDTSEYGGLATDTLQSKGRIDDFNANVLFLGNWTWPNAFPQNHLAVGLPINFSSPALMDLVKSAKAAGRDSVTLVFATAMDPSKDGIDISVDPEGVTTNFYNFNYIINTKESDPLKADTAWDPDVTDNGESPDPTPSGPGPWSGMSNADGRFSPKLYISVPEPSTLLLVALGLAALAMTRRK